MHDAIVIGGGPAGSTVATRLAQKKRRVILFEAEQFPRFHIGESLLPASVPLFEQLGVKSILDERFLRKNAAEFVSYDGSLTRRYPFSESLIGGPGFSYEVDRASFDNVLLENAANKGVDVRQGHEVSNIEIESDGVRVRVRDEKGATEEHRAKFLLDASGQRSMLAGRLGLREMDAGLKNFAVFSHFDGADRHSGDREGDITVVLSPEGWWWVIPLRDDRTSVGMVAPAKFLRGRKPDEKYFAEQIESCPYLAKRLAKAKRVAPVRTISDYSYASKRIAGERWLLVGDAAAFIDPVFSTGVCLGMLGGFKAADAVDRALANGRRPDFAAYDRWVKNTVGQYRRFVKGFYTPEFVEVLMHPSDTLELRRAVTSLLAGLAPGRFDIHWRTLAFRGIARVNRILPLTPRLTERREAQSGNRSSLR